jgi:hypothetical protein
MAKRFAQPPFYGLTSDQEQLTNNLTKIAAEYRKDCDEKPSYF